MRFNGLVSRDRRLLVKRDTSLPGAVLAAFAPLGGAWVLFSVQIAAEGRLGR
jgi:hypothetical protein